jgi:hypothetical protein
MTPPEKKAIRRPAKTNCYIKRCSNKSAIWIERHEGGPNFDTWVEAKVCVTHADGQKRARNQDG